jgi:hypothetical protein
MHKLIFKSNVRTGSSLHLILDVEVTEQSLDCWHQKGLQRAKKMCLVKNAELHS